MFKIKILSLKEIYKKQHKVKLSQITSILEQLAPTAYAEDFDNVGLLVGDFSQEIKGILVCHDALEDVIEEAIEKQCNLVVCFHPIIFSGIKKLTGKNYVERAVLKAIKNDIAIYALHTGLDNHSLGVNKLLCEALKLKNTKILLPKKEFIYKLTTYCPKETVKTIQEALFQAGAGAIGNYYNCSFLSQGVGTFTGNENTNPTIGIAQQPTEVQEVKVEVVFEKHLKNSVLSALFKAHVYEEVAYELVELQNEHQQIGLGMIGELETETNEKEFLNFVKKTTEAQCIRHSAWINKPIKKVAVLGGSGSFAISAAKAQKADVYITADLKYHDFFQAENQLIIADVGHFESERFVKKYIFDYLKKKIPNFAIILSDINTNPVNYI